MSQRNAPWGVGRDVSARTINTPVIDMDYMQGLHQAPPLEGVEQPLRSLGMQLQHQQPHHVACVAIVRAIHSKHRACGNHLAHLIDTANQSRVSSRFF